MQSDACHCLVRHYAASVNVYVHTVELSAEAGRAADTPTAAPKPSTQALSPSFLTIDAP